MIGEKRAGRRQLRGAVQEFDLAASFAG